MLTQSTEMQPLKNGMLAAYDFTRLTDAPTRAKAKLLDSNFPSLPDKHIEQHVTLLVFIGFGREEERERKS